MTKGFFASVRWAHIFTLIFLTGVVFFAISKTFDLSGFSTTMMDADRSLILLGLCISLLGSVLGTWRWQSLLAVIGHQISFKRVFLINMSNGPLMLLPGRVGDFVKAYALKNEIPMSHTVGTIILEKVIDISSLLLFVTVGGYASGYRATALWALAILIGVLVTIGILIKLRGRLLSKIPFEKMRNGLEKLSHILPFILLNKKKLAVSMASSLANWSTNVFMVYFFFRGVHATVPIGPVFALLPLGLFVGLIPLTIAGMGTRDSALIALFGPFAQASQSLGVGILYSAATYWLAILLGIPFFRYMRPLESLGNTSLDNQNPR